MVKRGPLLRPQASKEKRSMDHFAGLDVSVKETSVCIVDDTGRIVREVKVASEPEALLSVLTNPARTGLRMMPTFPRSSLSFRTAGFPQYGWKAGKALHRSPYGLCPY